MPLPVMAATHLGRSNPMIRARRRLNKNVIELPPHSNHFDFNKFFQTGKDIGTFFSSWGFIGRGGARILLAHDHGSHSIALGQLVRHEEMVLQHVLQIGAGEKQ
jgi:hypothetical protein